MDRRRRLPGKGSVPPTPDRNSAATGERADHVRAPYARESRAVRFTDHTVPLAHRNAAERPRYRSTPMVARAPDPRLLFSSWLVQIENPYYLKHRLVGRRRRVEALSMREQVDLFGGQFA